MQGKLCPLKAIYSEHPCKVTYAMQLTIMHCNTTETKPRVVGVICFHAQEFLMHSTHYKICTA